MPYSYVDLARLKGSAGLDLGTGTTLDATLRVLVENVTEQIDQYSNRRFQPLIETRTYDGPGSASLLVTDLIAVSSIKEDDNEDGTFNVTWGSNDFLLAPYNAAPTQEWGRPYTRIDVSDKSNGTQDTFLRGQQNYEIAGTWGFNKVVATSGLDGTLATTAIATLTLSGSVGSTIAAGQTLEYGSEHVYVTEVANSTSTAVTVRRAQNGSTATAGTAIAVNIFEYPGPVTEAAFVQVARLWRRKDSAFASEAGMTQTGQLVTFSGGLDADVKQLLAPVRKRAI